MGREASIYVLINLLCALLVPFIGAAILSLPDIGNTTFAWRTFDTFMWLFCGPIRIVVGVVLFALNERGLEIPLSALLRILALIPFFSQQARCVDRGYYG